MILRNHNRRGAALRALLVVLAALAALPLLVVGIALVTYQASRVHAQEDRRAAAEQAAARDVAIKRNAEADFRDAMRPDQAAGYRPVHETEYREERVTVNVPIVDPETGQTTMKTETITRRVPIVVTRYARTHLSPHDPRVAELVQQLRAMKEDEPQRESRMDELRKRLELEFAQMHERQAREIARTEERLDSLKRVHEQRGENKEEIVQRRMDELLGRADALRWHPLEPNQPQPHDSPLATFPRAEMRDGMLAGPDAPPRRGAFQPPSQTLPSVVPVPGVEVRPGQIIQRIPSSPVPPTHHPPGADVVDPARTRASLPSTFFGKSVQIQRVPSQTDSLFSLARSLASLKLELATAESELTRLSQLNERDAVTANEVEKLAAKVQRLRQQMELDELEFESLSEALDRDLKLAEETLARMTEAKKFLEAQIASGKISPQQMVEVELALAKARKEREDARARMEQLEQARALVDRPMGRRDDLDGDVIERSEPDQPDE